MVYDQDEVPVKVNDSNDLEEELIKVEQLEKLNVPLSVISSKRSQSYGEENNKKGSVRSQLNSQFNSSMDNKDQKNDIQLTGPSPKVNSSQMVSLDRDHRVSPQHDHG